MPLVLMLLAMLWTSPVGAADISDALVGRFFAIPGGDRFEKTEVMSLTKDLRYGWRARTTRSGTVRCTMVLTIPAKGYNHDGVAVVPGKTRFESVQEIAIHGGMFGHAWKPAADDPGGVYALTVQVDGEVILQRTFSLLPP